MRSHLSWSIIKQFSSRNIFGFTFQDAMSEFPEKNRIHLARTLANMVANGMLCKISRGIYHIPPINADPKKYVPDRLQVAKYLILNKEYYIGYASAMRIHGLTLQLGDRDYVVTAKQTKPSIRNFEGIRYEFLQHDSSHFFGLSDIWINQNEKAMVSDLEKTIVDCATKPQYCGGILEVGKAILLSKSRIDHDKLFYYFARNENKSAKKRFLFLTNLLGLEWTNDHERMIEELGSGISLLDPTAPNQGRKRSKFGLKINVDPIHIKKKVLDEKLS